jgi:predicted component of type VI protein secretion system
MIKTYKLILQTGLNAGTEYLLDKDELFLGRDVNNDIVINDPEVSRRHARLIRQGEDYVYEDLGSTNGSFIQGQRLVSPTILKHGTMLTIGERVMISYSADTLDTFATVAAPRYSPSVNQPSVQPSFSDNKQTLIPSAPSIVQVPPAQVPPVPVAPVSQAYVPPVYKPTPSYPPAPSFVPPAPVMTPPPPAAPYYPVQPKKKSKGVMILLIILGVILIFCVIPWLIVELTNSYCALFPGIFNAIQAGSCPV